MLLVTHTILGAAVGAAVPVPGFNTVLGVAVHHIADGIPHFDPGSFHLSERGKNYAWSKRDWVIVGVDVALTIVVLFLIWKSFAHSDHLFPIATGIMGGNLPDVVDNVPFWKDKLRKNKIFAYYHQKIHDRIHFTVPAKLWYLGVITQALVIGGAWWVLSNS